VDRKLDIIKKLVQLSSLQKQAAIVESEVHMNRLTSTITQLIDIEKNITDNLSNQELLVALTNQLKSLVINTTIELQFYDRLKQKLQHADSPLTEWTELGKIKNPNDEEFINDYSTEEERYLYQQFMESGDIEKTLQSIESFQANKSLDDELF